jgi:hypothetical protein
VPLRFLPRKSNSIFKDCPLPYQAEVLDFVEYLVAKAEREALEEEEAWSDLSLSFAMRGMEYKAVPTYTASDLKVVFP